MSSNELSAPTVRQDGLQLDEHRGFQEGFWKVERFAWAAFVGFVALALLGLTGDGGAFARATATVPGATLDYPRIGRWEASDTFFVRFDAAGRQRTLLLSPEFASNFEIRDIQPTPEHSEASAEGNRMIFSSAEGQPMNVKLELRAHAPGLTTYGVAVDEGALGLIDMLILP